MHNLPKKVGKVAKNHREKVGKVAKIDIIGIEKLQMQYVGVILCWKEKKNYIDSWIQSGRDALLITGARQIGKTYLIKRMPQGKWSAICGIKFY